MVRQEKKTRIFEQKEHELLQFGKKSSQIALPIFFSTMAVLKTSNNRTISMANNDRRHSNDFREWNGNGNEFWAQNFFGRRSKWQTFN